MDLGYKKIKMNRFEIQKTFNVKAVSRLHLNFDVYENCDSFKLVISSKITGKVIKEITHIYIL